MPSIASVSRFTLTTREADDATGEATQVIIGGGKILEVKAAASPAGTTIEVRQLFFNLPARRKFLRAEETERAHIQHYLTLVALAWPGVGFTFTSDARLVWQLPAVKWTSAAERAGALRERLRQLHGADVPLLPVDFTAEVQETGDDGLHEESLVLRDAARFTSFRVWGFIGAPGVSRATRDEQHLFVNQRPVDNRGLNFALLEGYHNALMKGRYPVCCLFLELDPAAVDVNVHPQKREVKFREEPAVRRLVAKAVRDTLAAFHQPAEAAGGPVGKSESGKVSPSAPEPAPLPELKLEPPRPAAPAPVQRTLPVGFSPPAERPMPPQVAAVPTPPNPLPALAPTPESPRPLSHFPTCPPATGVPVPLLRVPLRLVGVVGRLYVVLESDRGLVLLDQHAAHERILYEQMLQRLEKAEAAPSQRLLLPETIELSPRDATFVRQHLDILSRLGVGLREFGERTFLLDALPPFVRGGNPRQFAFQLVDELKAAGAGINTLRLGEDMVAKTVCRHAVKANDPLAGKELEHLVEDLRRCEMPYTCPHGRPTLIEMSWRELEKKFGRTG